MPGTKRSVNSDAEMQAAAKALSSDDQAWALRAVGGSLEEYLGDEPWALKLYKKADEVDD